MSLEGRVDLFQGRGILYRGNNRRKQRGTGKDNDFPVAGVVHDGEGGPDAIYIWITKGSRDCNQRTQWGLYVSKRFRVTLL